MNGYKGDEKDRKLMIPVAAIFMSVVALVGLGFALTSSVSNNGNSVVADDFALNLYEDDNGATEVSNLVFNGGKLPYVVDTTVTSSGSTKTITFDTAEITLNPYKVYLGSSDFVNGTDYTITMKLTATTASGTSPFEDYNLYIVGSDGSQTLVADADNGTDGVQFTVSTQYTQIALKATPLAGGTMSSIPSMPTIDVTFSVEKPETA